jgi:hypothetical protein
VVQELGGKPVGKHAGSRPPVVLEGRLADQAAVVQRYPFLSEM